MVEVPTASEKVRQERRRTSRRKRRPSPVARTEISTIFFASPVFPVSLLLLLSLSSFREGAAGSPLRHRGGSRPLMWRRPGHVTSLAGMERPIVER